MMKWKNVSTLGNLTFRFTNGDTRPKLLIRSRYLLFKSSEKWTEKQKERVEILFKEYHDIHMAYGQAHSLRMIFAKTTIKDAARPSMARWYNKVDESRIKSFNAIAATLYEHYHDILNFLQQQGIKRSSRIIQCQNQRPAKTASDDKRLRSSFFD